MNVLSDQFVLRVLGSTNISLEKMCQIPYPKKAGVSLLPPLASHTYLVGAIFHSFLSFFAPPSLGCDAGEKEKAVWYTRNCLLPISCSANPTTTYRRFPSSIFEYFFLLPLSVNYYVFRLGMDIYIFIYVCEYAPDFSRAFQQRRRNSAHVKCGRDGEKACL